jgi:hypothetical protein
MTTEQKAIDLVQRFEGLTAQPFNGNGNIRLSESVRQRALVCVDEIIKTGPISFAQSQTGGPDEIVSRIPYWQAVRDHILSL